MNAALDASSNYSDSRSNVHFCRAGFARRIKLSGELCIAIRLGRQNTAAKSLVKPDLRIVLPLKWNWNYFVRLARARAIAAATCCGAVPPVWFRLARDPSSVST